MIGAGSRICRGVGQQVNAKKTTLPESSENGRRKYFWDKGKRNGKQGLAFQIGGKKEKYLGFREWRGGAPRTVFGWGGGNFSYRATNTNTNTRRGEKQKRGGDTQPQKKKKKKKHNKQKKKKQKKPKKEPLGSLVGKKMMGLDGWGFLESKEGYQGPTRRVLRKKETWKGVQGGLGNWKGF